ncbi:MAG: hypothetical protein AAFU79_28055, partial [Myxococcota bacterium]
MWLPSAPTAGHPGSMWCMLTALLAGPLPGSDAAWALTEGSPAVTLTVVGEGEDLSDPEWAGRIVLNLG